MQKQDIVNLTIWAQKDFSVKDFCTIFNIPYPTSKEICNSISYIAELFSNYSWYLQSIPSNKTINKTQEHFTYLLSDIFGELAISIKLAAEGYIKYSLREIRSVLDILYAGLYITSTWTYDNQKIEGGINPMAEAFFSGYWDKMKYFSLDDLVITSSELKDGKTISNLLLELSNELYPEIIEKFNFNINNIYDKDEKKLKKILANSLGDFFTKSLKESNEWSDVKNAIFKDIDYFYWLLMNNNEITCKACEEHLDKLLENLKKKLGIEEKLTDNLKQNLSKLVFTKSEFNEEDYNLCDYCDNKATIYGIFSRPDPTTMRKLIKLQLGDNILKELNSCIKESFKVMHKEIKEKKSYFGDIIHHEIYAKLDNYVHSNIVPEPEISEWLYDYFIPTVVVLQCILSTPIWEKYLK